MEGTLLSKCSASGVNRRIGEAKRRFIISYSLFQCLLFSLYISSSFSISFSWSQDDVLTLLVVNCGTLSGHFFNVVFLVLWLQFLIRVHLLMKKIYDEKGVMDVEEIMAQKIDKGCRAYKKHVGPPECATLRSVVGERNPVKREGTGLYLKRKIVLLDMPTLLTFLLLRGMGFLNKLGFIRDIVMPVSIKAVVSSWLLY